ncbi:hypothetical protein PHISCL_05923 [Aspergillus sclerotialis]|uniref:AA9 family lytic polysaccharide monooxygenase n=1 Tax=Aspergillus sclerotialis TaxID=2070753 RepID=A0A3A2ZF05_9EURO|nr:hypothetical protein PHISCL_05923 [Aspergillus sclerotialis]
MHFALPTLLIPFLQFLLVSAHTTFTTLYVDGVTQGDGVCIRMNRNADKASDPIEPITSKDVACGYDGEKGVSRVCAAKASSTLTFEFHEYADKSQPGSIAPSHKGPCAVYMKKVDDATANDNASGNGWFKIWESGYDETDGRWCTEKMIDNDGHVSVTIPSDIQAGYYLVRPELLALHAAADNPPDPQLYVGCAQVFVQSDGSATPETVNIGQGTYDLDAPGLKFNIWDSPMKLPYTIFGPPVYKAETESLKVDEDGNASNSSGKVAQGESKWMEPATADPTTPSVNSTDALPRTEVMADEDKEKEVGENKYNVNEQNGEEEKNEEDYGEVEEGNEDNDEVGDECEDRVEDEDDADSTNKTACASSIQKRAPMVQSIGLKPAGCILVRDNWCGYEVPSYTDENGCWASSKDCWNQSDICWNTAPPTGNANCKIWQKKCEELDDSCRNKNFNGPPNKGKDLTPSPPLLSGPNTVSQRDWHRRNEILRREMRRRKVYAHGHY